MKFSLRVTLTASLVSLILLTVVALGYCSYRNACFTADDLATQIRNQTSQQIDGQINAFLMAANEQGQLNLRLIQSGELGRHDLPRLARYWREVLEVRRFTSLSLARESTGEWFYVRRRRDGSLLVGELRRNVETGTLDHHIFRPDDYPDRSSGFETDRSDQDPRTRSWYTSAKQARRPMWSETYSLTGVDDDAQTLGVTCGTPFYAADGSLRGVLSASFNVTALCTSLKGLRVGEHGYAFIVEFLADGTRRVIAHPESSLLIRSVAENVQGERRRSELVPPGELKDRRVPAFLNRLPKGLNPSTLKGTVGLRFVHDGVPYVGSYQCLSSTDTPNWLVCVVMPESDVLARVEHNNLETAGIGLAILVVATLAGLYISAEVARPLERLARETESIGRLRVEPYPVAHSIVREVDTLAVAVEETKTSLRSFQKYVPADLVRLLLASGQEARLGGELRTVTVSFCDLANFTAVSEALTPDELVRHLGDYFGTFSAEILAAGGTVDKYIGDAIMSFWGAPAEAPRHALAACTTALRCQAVIKGLRHRWAGQGKPPLFARIGIHTGEVVVGNIGCEARLNYTVMGDAANLASRLEGLNKYYGTEILIGEATYREARPAVLARPVDWVSVKGKTEAVQIYELLGLRDETRAVAEDLAEVSDRALTLYRRRDWAGAIRNFEQAIRLRSDDGPARMLIARCRRYQAQTPAEDWDGVHRMDFK